MIQAEPNKTGSKSIRAGTTVEAFPRWYAVYTRSRHEKYVREQCERRAIESFLPVYETVHRWKDRRVRVVLPLFASYVFIRIELNRRLDVLQVPGVARLVGFDGTPAALPEEEIEALRVSLASGVRIEPHPYLSVGRRVRVTNGPLAGFQGVLRRRKRNARLVVSMELIHRAMAVEIDEADVQSVA